MTIEWNGRQVSFRRATSECTNEVLNVLDEVAGWLRAQGIRQ